MILYNMQEKGREEHSREFNLNKRKGEPLGAHENPKDFRRSQKRAAFLCQTLGFPPFWRKTAGRLKGWKSVEDIQKTLGVKKSTAYLYAHELDKRGFAIQKIKKPRGTLYLFSSAPSEHKHFGVYEKSELIAPEFETSAKPSKAEQKICFFLKQWKERKNIRYYNEAKRIFRNAKDWKLLYRYAKAYSVKREIAQLYADARKTVKKIPRMPERYKKLLEQQNNS